MIWPEGPWVQRHSERKNIKKEKEKTPLMRVRSKHVQLRKMINKLIII